MQDQQWLVHFGPDGGRIDGEGDAVAADHGGGDRSASQPAVVVMGTLETERGRGLSRCRLEEVTLGVDDELFGPSRQRPG